MKFQARNNYIINWPEYPLLRITLCFIAGIYLSDLFTIPLSYTFLLSIALVGLFMLWNSSINQSRMVIRILSSLVLLIGVSLGMLRGNLQKSSNQLMHFSKHIEAENLLVGRLMSEPKHKSRVSTSIEILQIDGKQSRGKLLVYFSKQDSVINYQLGDVIAIQGKIQILKDNSNPSSFNFKDHLKYKGIDYQIFLKDGKHKLLSSDGANIIDKTASQIRKWALSIFERRLKDNDQLATASAMVLGYREHLSDDLYTSFSETGAVHVLAVSGLHVGIICMIFIFLFNRFKSESNTFKMVKLVTLLSVVWIYALVTGASPAVLRAAVMFSFILIGRLWFKGANIYNILAFSALIILIYDPYLLFQLSFQFSYLALISILFFQPHFESIYETKHWVSTKIWQLSTVSIAAQILIFPISIFYFHKFPIYFILSGVAAVFLATFILGFGLLLLCCDRIPIIGDVISEVYSKLLEGFIQIISGIQSLPYNNVDGVYISEQSVILLYILIGVIMFLISLKPSDYKDVFQKKLKRKRIAKSIFALCIILLVSQSMLFSYRIKNHQELIVYDISNDTAIDIFYGNKLYTFLSENIDEKKVEFACKSYRILNGNPMVLSLNNDSLGGSENSVMSENGSMIFKNRHLIFADKLNFENAIPCESDIVFVVNKIELLPYEFLSIHTTSLVVLDNSLSFKVKNQWIKECQKRNIGIHDIRNQGVFRL